MAAADAAVGPLEATSRELEAALVDAVSEVLLERSEAPVEALALRLLASAPPASVRAARERVAATHRVLQASLAQLDVWLRAGESRTRAAHAAGSAPTSCKGFLQSLEELIGLPVAVDC